jgi:hypothetical protein
LIVATASCSSSSSSSGSSGSNGESSKSASQIVTDAKNAMESLNSFHLAGDVNQSGQTIKFDLVLTQTVGGGTMSLGSSQFQIVDDGTNGYIMGDANFWSQVGGANSSTAQLLSGKWIFGFSGQDLQQLAQLANSKNLLDSLTSSETSNSTKGPVTQYLGQDAIPLKGKDGSIGYVAATGPAYILGVKGPSGQGEVVFDQFNTATPPQVPTNAVNFNNLGG